MAASNENSDRRIVPRWRTFREAVEQNELSPATVVKARTIDSGPFLTEKEQQWLIDRELPFAIDLVSAATVLGGSEIANKAAEFILEHESEASRIAQNLARNLLGIHQPEESSNRIVSRSVILSRLRDLKLRRISQARNAFVWVDLARLYVLLGQIEPARAAIRVALNLAPTERFVLRSATRFFLHSMDHDEALQLLRSNSRTPVDPWLTAAEIAVSSVMDKKPKYARQGQELLKRLDIPAFHSSELSTALGSLEMFEGNDRKANKLFTASLKDPTENALAQVVWASSRTGLGEVNANLLLNANEAKAFNADHHGKWDDVVNYGIKWSQEEAFSSRPRQLTSAVATSLLGKPALGVEIAQEGLVVNPGHPGLCNNLAFAFLEQGKVQEAVKAIESVDTNQLTMIDRICLTATIGLVHFRMGDAKQGRQFYETSIEAASRQDHPVLKTLARMYLARELVLQKDPDGMAFFQKVQGEAKKFTNTSLPHRAELIAKEITEVSLQSVTSSESNKRANLEPGLIRRTELPSDPSQR